MLCKCGAKCEECRFYPNECPGCEELSGIPFWSVENMGGKPCPIYQCGKDKTYLNCGECAKLPCQIWYDLKDPGLSDQEHLDSIERRVARLRKEGGAHD